MLTVYGIEMVLGSENSVDYLLWLCSFTPYFNLAVSSCTVDIPRFVSSNANGAPIVSRGSRWYQQWPDHLL